MDDCDFMTDCIFGIKCNGVSINVSPLSIDDDQSRYPILSMLLMNYCGKPEWH